MKQFSFTFLLFFFLGLIGYSQDYWKSYRLEDGLLTDSINQLSVDDNKVYLATQKGFSIFENEQFTNYDTSNSSLKSNRILLINHFKDTVWLVTDSGLSKFHDGNFQHYDTSQGFPATEINSLEIDSKGKVWLGSLDGLSWVNGNTIITEGSRSVYSIAINKGDTIYANVNFPQIHNSGSPLVTFEIYFNGVWEEPNYTTPGLGDGKLVKLSNQGIGVVTNTHGCFIIDDGFNFINVVTSHPSSFYYQYFDLEIDSSDNYWVPYSFNLLTGYNGVRIRKAKGGFEEEFTSGLPQKTILDIESKNGKIYLASSDGFAIASDNIQNYGKSQFIETSVLKATIGSNGSLFSERDENGTNLHSGFEFPKGFGKNLIRYASLWFYGIDQSGNDYVSVNYEPFNDFEEGTINDNKSQIRSSYSKISRENIRYHLKNYMNSNYQLPESIKNWGATHNAEEAEANDLAPFIDVNKNGCYDPENGDYPYMVGDEAVYFVYNDLSSGVFSSNTEAMGLEIHGMAYVYERDNLPYLSHSIFFKYFIVNRSGKNYSLKTGLNFDFDIGNPLDDYLGCSPSQNVFFGYNADNMDENPSSIGYGDTIPAIGVKVYNRNLENFIGFSDVPPPPYWILPTNDVYYKNLMNGMWGTRVPLTYGGTGYDPLSTDTTKFLFPGDPTVSNEWSMVHPRQNEPSVPPQLLSKSLGIIEPVNLKPNERYQLDFVVGVGLDSSNTNYLDNIDVLIENLNKAARFQQGVDSIAPKFTYSTCAVGIEEKESIEMNAISIYPNPTSTNLYIKSKEEISSIRIYSLNGKLMFTKLIEERNLKQFELHFEDAWAAGFYFISVAAESGEVYNKKFVLNK